MALFRLFGRKKEAAQPKEMPTPPTPPSPLKQETDAGIKSPQHVDDFGSDFIPIKDIGKDAGLEKLKPISTSLELPELEFPKFDIPKLEEDEIKRAVEGQAKPTFTPRETKSVPEELPDIEAIQPPKGLRQEELVTIEEPIELRPTPKAKGPVFIRSDQFKEIKNTLNGLRETLEKSEETLNNLSEIKNREDSEYESWHSAAEAIQRKLLYVDRTFFE